MDTNGDHVPERRLRIGMYWACSCGGCDISLLEIGPRILTLLEIADVVLWPCVADFKYDDVAAYPDEHIDICFFNGGIRSSEQEEIARLLRQKSRTLVGYGACALGGGIPALANLKSRAEIYDVVYHRNVSIDNRSGVEPELHYNTPYGELELPEFYPAVLRLGDIVPVDYEIPGCPPQADQVWATIEAVVSGAVPPRNSAVRVGCTDRNVCDECTREKRLVGIKAFKRHHQVRAEPGWCLMEQGIVCMGPATRSGCGALCLNAGMVCEGCYGPPSNVQDQATAMIGALGALLDAPNEQRARQMVAQIADPTGTFYRFGLSSGTLKIAK